MTDWLQAVLLGIIEGITEFLPISSTGHLLIAEKLGLGARSDTFNVSIQAGAILAVVFIYRERLLQLLLQWRHADNRSYALKLAAAFFITCVLGLVVKKLGLKLPETLSPIAWALLIGGVWILIAEQLASKLPDSTAITWRVAIAVGAAQMVAGIFPGTSRSAVTIFVAMLLGTSNRAAATEFAFLLGIPTMFAATALELHGALKDSSGGIHENGHENWMALGIAFVVSTITAFVAVKWLLRYIQSHRFTWFALYRIALGCALLLLAV